MLLNFSDLAVHRPAGKWGWGVLICKRRKKRSSFYGTDFFGEIRYAVKTSHARLFGFDPGRSCSTRASWGCADRVASPADSQPAAASGIALASRLAEH